MRGDHESSYEHVVALKKNLFSNVGQSYTVTDVEERGPDISKCIL